MIQLFVTSGDLAGIGAEICLKALVNPELDSFDPGEKVRLTFCLAPEALQACAALAGWQLRKDRSSGWRLEVPGGRGHPGWMELAFQPPKDPQRLVWEALGLRLEMPLWDRAFQILQGTILPKPGLVEPASALAACLSMACAWNLAQGCPDRHALVTPPIHKGALKALNLPYPGHTELLAALDGQAREGLTMFETGQLKVFFHTRHVSLRQACDLVTHARLLASIRRCVAALKEMSPPGGILAVAGLNPHNSDGGLFGFEEAQWIIPAVLEAQAEGLAVEGPIPADSVFHLAKTGRYAAVLSLYHDQGHIATKTLDFDRTVSLTLGLGSIRSSVDHGTAFDIAGQGRANETSMVCALRAGIRHARYRLGESGPGQG